MGSRRTKKDIAVEQALYGKAVGVYITQQEAAKCKHIEYTDTGKKLREDETLEVRDVQKYFPPEMAAIAMWLKARRPDVWGDSAPTVGTPVRIVDDVPAQNAPAAPQGGDPTLQGGDGMPQRDAPVAPGGAPAHYSVAPAPQGGDGMPQGGDRMPQGGDGMPQGGDRMPQGGDGMPQGDDGMPQGDDGMSQDDTCKNTPAPQKPLSISAEKTSAPQDIANVQQALAPYGNSAPQYTPPLAAQRRIVATDTAYGA